MTRRTAARAKAPRCASENRVHLVVASRGNPLDSSSARFEKRASWRTSRHDTNPPSLSMEAQIVRVIYPALRVGSPRPVLLP